MTYQNHRENGVARPKITLLMLACGIAAAASGVASAATPDTDVPSIAVRFSPQALETASGARAVYHRIVNAAAEVCPNFSSNPHWVMDEVKQCRAQAIARAVYKINNPQLVAVYTTAAKQG